MPTAVAIGEIAAERAEKGVDPLKEGENLSPVRLQFDPWDIQHHGGFHGGQHLSVEIIEQGDRDEEPDDKPGWPISLSCWKIQW